MWIGGKWTIVRVGAYAQTQSSMCSNMRCFGYVHSIAMWMSVDVVVVVGVDVSDDVYSQPVLSMYTCKVNNIDGTNSIHCTRKSLFLFTYVPPSLFVHFNTDVFSLRFFSLFTLFFSLLNSRISRVFLLYRIPKAQNNKNALHFSHQIMKNTELYWIWKLVVVRTNTRTLRHRLRTKRIQFRSSINHFFLNAYVFAALFFPLDSKF